MGGAGVLQISSLVAVILHVFPMKSNGRFFDFVSFGQKKPDSAPREQTTGMKSFYEQNQQVSFRFAEIVSWRAGGSSLRAELVQGTRAAVGLCGDAGGVSIRIH
jgi:hypothetical protein